MVFIRTLEMRSTYILYNHKIIFQDDGTLYMHLKGLYYIAMFLSAPWRAHKLQNIRFLF